MLYVLAEKWNILIINVNVMLFFFSAFKCGRNTFWEQIVEECGNFIRLWRFCADVFNIVFPEQALVLQIEYFINIRSMCASTCFRRGAVQQKLSLSFKRRWTSSSMWVDQFFSWLTRLNNYSQKLGLVKYLSCGFILSWDKNYLSSR